MSFTNTRDVIGDQATLDGLVAHTLTELKEDGVNKLRIAALKNNSGIISVELPRVSDSSYGAGQNAFGGCINLTTVSLQQATMFYATMFSDCTNLTSVIAPEVVSCGSGPFYSCRSLRSVNFPLMTELSNSMFQYCDVLSDVTLSTSVTNIPHYAFYYCYALNRISFPNVTAIQSHAFEYCVSLSEAYFPKVKTVGSAAFYRCTSLSSVSFPEVTTLMHNVFMSCPLKKLVLPKVSSMYSGITNTAMEVDLGEKAIIGAQAFYNDIDLFSLILRDDEMTTLNNTNALQRTPIEYGYGKIYVPGSLVSSYRAATNWATYAQQIDSINNYTGGAPVGGITDTWEEIFAAEQDGTYATKYHVGDLKWLLIGDDYYLVQIVAMDTDELADGNGNAKITWLCKGYHFARQSNQSDTATGGWASSYARTYLRESIFPLIDSIVRTSIKEVTKTYVDVVLSTNNGEVANTESIADTIWIPSLREISNESNTVIETSGCTYTGFFTDNASRIKYWKCSIYDPSSWWLRSKYNRKNHYYVHNQGSTAYSSQNTNMNIVFGFCT